MKNIAQFTPEQLTKIVQAFYDIADVIQGHEFQEYTGNSDEKAKQNFIEARNMVYAK
jgi:hypothetical protein